MKIGIDARQLSKPLTGIGRYTLEMCRVLATVPGISLYIYSPNNIKIDVSNLKNVTIKTKNFANPYLQLLWAETYLPLWARQDKVDVFWGPAHRLPLLLPRDMPKVVTIHDLVWKYFPASMRTTTRVLETVQMPLAIRKADYIITDAYATAAALQKEFTIDSQKISVIPLGSRSEDRSLPDNFISQPYFLFVGTLEPRKNLIRLLQAYAKLSEATKNKAMLVIVGGKGWGKVDLNKMIADLKLEKHVRLIGYVDEITLSTLYAHCIFLAMPSLYEGFGLPLLEAMSYGKPVITSNNSSMPEVVGEAGYLIDPMNIESIADGLDLMLTNVTKRDELASKAKPTAAKFSWQTAAQQLIEIFKKTIAIKKGNTL